MTLSKYQLERADITELEQGRRVWIEQDREDHRKMRTMGDLLQGRVYAATEYWEGLRKRMTEFQGGGSMSGAGYPQPAAVPLDPHPEHGVLCDCDDCDEAVKRLLRDCGILPKGSRDWGAFTVERAHATGRVRLPARYRRDESDV